MNKKILLAVILQFLLLICSNVSQAASLETISILCRVIQVVVEQPIRKRWMIYWCARRPSEVSSAAGGFHYPQREAATHEWVKGCRSESEKQGLWLLSIVFYKDLFSYVSAYSSVGLRPVLKYHVLYYKKCTCFLCFNIYLLRIKLKKGLTLRLLFTLFGL